MSIPIVIILVPWPPTTSWPSITWLVENDFNQMLLKFCGQVTWEIKLPLFLRQVGAGGCSLGDWWMCVWLRMRLKPLKYFHARFLASENAFEAQSSGNFQRVEARQRWLLFGFGFGFGQRIWVFFYSCLSVCLFFAFVLAGWLYAPRILFCVGAFGTMTTSW